jgi:hypothetical protein
MKKGFLLFVLIIGLTSSKPQDNVSQYDLATAIEKGIVCSEFTGNSSSPHYFQPINIQLENLTEKEIQVRIPIGQTFASKTRDYQDIITTQEEMIVLLPNETTKNPIFGMCIQQSVAAPNDEANYLLGDMASGDLLDLAGEIQKRSAFNTLGQYSVWTLTDDTALNAISGFDLKEATHFKTYVANLLGVPVPEYNPEDLYLTESEPIRITRTVGGKFRYKFYKTSNVTIGMFDDQDIIVRELYANAQTKPGEHFLKYEFDTEIYLDDVYYVRLIINGEIKINMEMKPRRS